MTPFKVSQFKSEGERYWQVSPGQGVYPQAWYSVHLLDNGEYAISAGASGRVVKPDGTLGKRLVRAVEAFSSKSY
jgi:hypothetical protein